MCVRVSVCGWMRVCVCVCVCVCVHVFVLMFNERKCTRDKADHAATVFSIKLYFLYFCEMERLSNLIAQGHLGSVFSSRKNHETEILTISVYL